jgi:hypothetical protein
LHGGGKYLNNSHKGAYTNNCFNNHFNILNNAMSPNGIPAAFRISLLNSPSCLALLISYFFKISNVVSFSNSGKLILSTIFFSSWFHLISLEWPSQSIKNHRCSFDGIFWQNWHRCIPQTGELYKSCRRLELLVDHWYLKD